ncbi:DUF7507 domain-containing protein [Leucobacter allii]|uniref:DUF7507 domain-containing protein n=1 Tax=Leucobacter allii TaxID=2932247 RepID=UPI0024B594F6|nr:hypothetical protein [Leucobacter allii]
MDQDSRSIGRRAGGWLVAASVVGASLFLGMPAAQAAPAPDAEPTTFTSGVDQTVVVPDGVCAVNVVVAGAPGGSAISSGTDDNAEDPEDPGAFRGPNGSGATVSAGLAVGAGDAIQYTVGGTGANGGAAGLPGGGAGSTGGHRGAGGGGYSSISVGGDLLILAGGGGGTGGGHTADGGHGGDAGVVDGVAIDGGTVYAGGDGTSGFDLGWNADPVTAPGAGLGGGVSAGGAGGVNPRSATEGYDFNGFPGGSLQGGNGGNDPGLDGGAGGGGGFFGGGGGASTDGQVGGAAQYFVGAGGGGGSTFVSDSALLSDPALAKNRVPAGQEGEGDTLPGQVTFEWIMCDYDLSVAKSVVGEPVYEDGQTVTYSVTVTNEGADDMAIGDTVSLVDDLAVGGTLVSVEGLDTSVPAAGEAITAAGIEAYDSIDVSDDPETPDVRHRGLAAGDSVTFVYDVVVTGTEPVTNTVTITDRGSEENNTASAEIQPAAPSLGLVKSADTEDITEIGQKVTYSFVVTNTGNISVDNISIAEGEFSGAGELPTPECPTGPVAPGESVTCTAVYTVVAEDITGEDLTNTATAAGETPMGHPVVSEESAAALESVPAPELTLVKTADANTVTHAGQKVTYSFEVTNTGNIPLDDIAIDEGAFSGTGELPTPKCPTGTVDPGESITCTSVYTALPGDVTGKPLTNTATATGVTLYGADVVSNASTAELASTAPLAVTGGQSLAAWSIGAVLALGLGGTALLLARRRQA